MTTWASFAAFSFQLLSQQIDISDLSRSQKLPDSHLQWEKLMSEFFCLIFGFLTPFSSGSQVFKKKTLFMLFLKSDVKAPEVNK